ncbi:MAG: esterase-like activity of phytase family protein [Verrucomicrobiales bacterium]|nr:esterase-like activity of phytase family protein [Verrucomicrobiales bacterium]
MALQDGKLYAFVQSPLRNPASLANSALTRHKCLPGLFNPANHVTRSSSCTLDNADLGGGGNTGHKIGDAVARGNGQFLVIERDDDKVGSDDAELIEKRIPLLDRGGRTDTAWTPGRRAEDGGPDDPATAA